MSPLILALVWFIPSLVILLLIGLKIFDENHKVDFSNFPEIIWDVRGGLFVLLLVYIALKIENTVKDYYNVGIKATEFFYRVEGVEHIVFLQNHLDHYLIIESSSLFYTLGLFYLVVFAPLFFMFRGERENFNLFSKMLMVNYFFLIPSYFILHVVVTSYYAPEVAPLLYSNDQQLALLHMINRLDNCFPSGHISVSLTITFLALFNAKLKRLGYFGIVFTALTGVVILYIGVHWALDIPAGIALGVFAYWSVIRGKWDFLFDPIMNFFEEKTEKLGK
ncbi:MAG: phosphatase PAP2 family protein [Thermoplasmata archaeon]